MAEDLNVPQQSMTIFDDGSFFQSPLFTSLLLATVTLIVGYVTYRIYKLQQKQVDRDAATIIYLQIKEFESRVNELHRQEDQFGINVLTKPFIREDSWSAYKSRIIKNIAQRFYTHTIYHIFYK